MKPLYACLAISMFSASNIHERLVNFQYVQWTQGIHKACYGINYKISGCQKRDTQTYACQAPVNGNLV